MRNIPPVIPLSHQLTVIFTGAWHIAATSQAAAAERRERGLQRSHSAAMHSTQVTKIDVCSTYSVYSRLCVELCSVFYIQITYAGSF